MYLQIRLPKVCPQNHLNETQVLPCGVTWLLKGVFLSSSKSTLKPWLRSFSLCFCLLGCMPFDFIWTPNVTFAKYHVILVGFTPSRTNVPKKTITIVCGCMCPNEPMHSSTFTSLGTDVPQTLVHSLFQCAQNSLVFTFSSSLPCHALPHAWASPLVHLCTQGTHFPN
jgi:hypothetical protein